MEQSWSQLAWIGLAVFLQGMNKGGLPVGPIALPVLVLMWPDQGKAAREAVGFLLPLLCVMDIVAVVLYRKDVLWKRIVPLLPSVIVGVALASALALSERQAILEVSDRALKGTIGAIGLLFVLYRVAAAWLLRRAATHARPGVARTTFFGLVAGVTSTLAHAAGPVMQIFYLPQGMAKMNYAATNAGFFLVINLIKVPFFVAHGRITPASLALNVRMAVLIPFGVFLGYALVRRLDPRHYIVLIHALLAGTSAVLALQAAGVL